ncbi:hypothetical protein GCM10010112_46130 [Actinoplanes lobatus]|uniref:Uncharacterized protein n=1 Tax=Actinoplanes lobatus TaxID=113568 RepID=A0A7W7HH89_9ACTN|nr:hypothetical protein [Actinoplanes lobatus]MBB4750097.1 hypothetical protein [Actinoplanes lobatus]GGN75173.1 hypothetical protein GCM10010112_46130 [Actinoplanes lobatus]GIE39014.1 hypothetical protein Alo02nite_19120 [Actinoplanes lobatus]
MRLVPPLLRRPWAALAAGAVALVAAVTAAALLFNGGPAAATWKSLSGTPTCDCVIKDSGSGKYRAVFGYVSKASVDGTIAGGNNNRLELTGGATSIDAKVTTVFQPGTHQASFATGWVTKETSVTWKVGGKEVTANWKRPTCGKDVSLPAGGNGLGPIVVFVAAGVVAGAMTAAGVVVGTVTVWHRRRRARVS